MSIQKFNLNVKFDVSEFFRCSNLDWITETMSVEYPPNCLMKAEVDFKYWRNLSKILKIHSHTVIGIFLFYFFAIYKLINYFFIFNEPLD